MRILYVGAVPPIPGGISQHGANLTTALRRQGASVRVVSWASQYPAWLYPGSTRSPDGAALSGTEWRLRWWDPTSWLRTARIARTADAVVLPWMTPFQAPAVGTILRAAHPALRVVVAHNPRPHDRRRLDESLTRWALAPAELALLHAEALVPELESLRPGIAALVAPHPPNLLVRVRPATDRPPLRLLFLGYVRPYKGLDVAIDAVEVLRGAGDDVQLTVAGEFWEPVERWQQLLRDRGLDDVVELRAGYVPDDQLEGLLAEHHLLVAPYRSATQSGIVPLALSAARPVVVSDVGGLREAVTDGVEGALVPPEDPQALADGIRRAAELIGQLDPARAPTWDQLATELIDRIGSEQRRRG